MTDKFCCKVHNSKDTVLLAVCDSDIVGKKFSSVKISIDISRDFYGESVYDEDEIISMAKSADVVNAIGKKTIRLLADKKLIEEDAVTVVCGQPHAQIFAV